MPMRDVVAWLSFPVLMGGFVAINYFVPQDAMAELAEDESPVVRGLVEWKAKLASEERVEA